jgi:hypothetical protein
MYVLLQLHGQLQVRHRHNRSSLLSSWLANRSRHVRDSQMNSSGMSFVILRQRGQILDHETLSRVRAKPVVLSTLARSHRTRVVRLPMRGEWMFLSQIFFSAHKDTWFIRDK